MTKAQVVYTLMSGAVGMMALIAATVLILNIIEIKRRWMVRIGRMTRYDPEHGPVTIFGIAVIRKFVAGVPDLLLWVSTISAALLVSFAVPALWNMWSTSPEMFLMKFQEYQRLHH